MTDKTLEHLKAELDEAEAAYEDAWEAVAAFYDIYRAAFFAFDKARTASDDASDDAYFKAKENPMNDKTLEQLKAELDEAELCDLDAKLELFGELRDKGEGRAIKPEEADALLSELVPDEVSRPEEDDLVAAVLSGVSLREHRRSTPEETPPTPSTAKPATPTTTPWESPMTDTGKTLEELKAEMDGAWAAAKAADDAAEAADAAADAAYDAWNVADAILAAARDAAWDADRAYHTALRAQEESND